MYNAISNLFKGTHQSDHFFHDHLQMKEHYKTILLFGFLLAILAVAIQFLQYNYFSGSLDQDIYTSIIAIIFTIVGIYIGVNSLKKRTDIPESTEAVIQSKVKEMRLNEREYEILQLIAKGHSNQGIADQLFLALPTIKTHISNLYMKLGVRSRTQAIHKARVLKLL